MTIIFFSDESNKKENLQNFKNTQEKKKNNQKIFCEECMEIKMGKGKIYFKNNVD